MPFKKNRPNRKSGPCFASALTIAGSDSGGGAGIQADLKTFSALGLHGTCAITAVTAQNPKGVKSVSAIPTQIVVDQIQAVLTAFPVPALKTGMLFSAEIISAVADRLKNYQGAIIVDPVMIATSGSVLLKPDAVGALQRGLFPLATLVTPNLPEAEALLSKRIKSLEELRSAAREFHARYGCAALLKGGHLRGMREAVDFFFDGHDELMLQAPRISGVSTHGTGCTYSAAITAYCARGYSLSDSVTAAKEFISNAIAASQKYGPHFVLDSFWKR